MLRKGFTLIELLIVITIIAILAGAAIPYVQDYIDEGRKARAKQDLTEIRNALVRWELERSVYASNSIEPLVGPFLSQLLIDPWGAPYYIDLTRSHVRSFGLDGADDDGLDDDLTLDFRPPMAVTKVEYTDADGSGSYTIGDYLTFYFTRPVNNPVAAADLAAITVGGVALNNAAFSAPTKTVGAVAALDGTDRKAYVEFAAVPAFTSNNIVITRNPAPAVQEGFCDMTPDAVADTVYLAWQKAGTLKLKATGF